ncbi:MAG: PilZ domain-containing protein [Lachnospiraceae bacterium]|nr:PilZ domain-containing protein [Candidatus Colinaster equi]
MEKRKYIREDINRKALFYIQGAEFGRVEFSGITKNISECGMAIEICGDRDIDIAGGANVGDVIKFVIVDEFEYMFEKRDWCVSGKAKVIRMEYIEDKLIIGCEFSNLPYDVEEYIVAKKVVTFQSNGYQI